MIKVKSAFVGTLILAQFPLVVLAADQCLSGKPENTHLIDQLKTATTKSAISKALTEKYHLNEAPAADKPIVTCASCMQGPGTGALSQDNLSNAQLLSRLVPDGHMIIRADCIEAGGTPDTNTAELKCPQGTSSSRYNFCFDKTAARYQNAVITDFYKCVKKLTNFPLSPRGIFEMYSLESGFKPHFAYGGGVGIGQLTGIYVADINQKHRGYEFLKQVADSSDPDCSIAKKIASKDAKQPLQLGNNRCKFVEYGEGMERNVLYSLIGMANAWDKDIGPLMNSYVERNKSNPDTARAAELALLNSYGPGGRAAARAAVRRLTKLSPKEFVSRISKPMSGTHGGSLSSYITKMNTRQQELAKKMPAALRDAHNKVGAQSCVNY